MSEIGTTFVVLCQDDGRGNLTTGESFTIEELGGVVPVVGDLLHDPMVPNGWTRGQTEGRRWKEVTRRYLFPAEQRIGARIFLVVEDRPATPAEADVLER